MPIGWAVGGSEVPLLISKQGELDTPSATDKQSQISLAKQPYSRVLTGLVE